MESTTRDPDRTRFESLAKDAYQARVETMVMLARIEEQFKAHKEEDAKNFSAIHADIKELQKEQAGASIEIGTNKGKESERTRIGALIFSILAFLGMVIDILIQGMKK